MADSDHVKMEWSIISDFIILGTNLCCTSHAQELYDLGIKADIDLELERSHEPMNVEVSLWLPTEDKTAPSLEQLFTGTAALKQLVDREQLTYLHCRYGHGRSPTLVAAYLIRTGLNIDEAITHIAAKRPEIHIETVQHRQLEQFAQLL